MEMMLRKRKRVVSVFKFEQENNCGLASSFSLFDVAVKKTQNNKKENKKKGKGSKWNKGEINV